MASKSVTQVLIGGKIYTLSGYESEEYLQKVAGYLSNKLGEIKSAGGYRQMGPETRSLMLNLNIADDYFKMKKQADQLNDQLAQKDKELYDIKHELIQAQMKLENTTQSMELLQDTLKENQKRILQLETQLETSSNSPSLPEEDTTAGE